jgi:hypothetical protein
MPSRPQGASCPRGQYGFSSALSLSQSSVGNRFLSMLEGVRCS